MPAFSIRSLERLNTCDKRLQAVMHEAIKHYDFSVLCGHRSKAAQTEALNSGASKKPWPLSKHNASPSLAVDIAPYPIDWEDMERFKTLAEVVKAAAQKVGVELKWGGDWKTFIDFPHWELKQ